MRLSVACPSSTTHAFQPKPPKSRFPYLRNFSNYLFANVTGKHVGNWLSQKNYYSSIQPRWRWEKRVCPWAPYHGERAGIKLQVALRAEIGQPLQVVETLGSKHDGPMSEALAQPDYILVMDRAYGNYKAWWQIEVFFRWIKQHLNIPTLFGTTENAVYGQLFCALIVYVLLNWLFVAAQTSWPQHAVLSFARFSRLFLLQNYLLNGWFRFSAFFFSAPLVSWIELLILVIQQAWQNLKYL